MIAASEIERIPANPPRRLDLLPGLNLARSVPRRLLWFPLTMLAFFAVFPLVIMSQEPTAQLSLRSTRSASGRVESAEPARACPDGVEVRYSFSTPDGVTWKGRDRECPPSPYSGLQVGDSIPVVHLEADPSVSAIADDRSANGAKFAPFLVLPLFVLVFFIPMFGPRFAQLRRDRKLFRTGSFAPGRVVFVRGQREGQMPGWPPGLAVAEVFVAARLASGEEREVKAGCTNDWVLAHLPPGAEVHVCVVGDRGVLIENYLR